MKPCPFCGSGDVGVVEFLDGEGDRLFAVGCSGCGCHGAPHVPLMDDARPAAIASWERRVPKVEWLPISWAPQDGTRLMLWDSVSKRPVFGSWRGGNPAITHYAAEPAGPGVS
ncbi:TPA: Lar family restriction alleviation protein [Stenotrophomonas maltophilia]